MGSLTNRRSGRRVLLVDDDPASRQTLARALGLLGHDVETAQDGLEALAKLSLGVDLLLALSTVRDMLEVQRGRHFDPEVLDAFLGQWSRVEAVYRGMPESAETGW